MESYNDYNEPLFNNENEDKENFGDIDNEIKSSIREGFISKVFGIVAYQMIILFTFVFFGYTFPTLRLWLLTSRLMFIISFIISIILLLLPIASPNIFRKVPLNYIILTIFTLSYSWWIAAFVVIYTKQTVLLALFLTIVLTISLSIYAIKTNNDITILGGTLFSSLILFIITGIIFMFISIPLFNILSIYGGLVLFSIYLIYDIQLIVGNKSHQFGEDDYILAALNLYLDIISLFIRILAIVGEKEN